MFLKKIDFFGTQLNFTLFGNSSYNTKFGGIITILLFATLIFLTISFGNDFVMRNNPSIISERVIPDNYEYKSLNLSNMPIFWSIYDDDSHPVNFTGILYPQLILYVFKYNKTTQIMDKIDQKSMSVKNCTGLVDNTVYKQLDLSSFYCLDFAETGYPMGGFWDSSYMVYYFEQVFSYCPDDKKDSGKCTDTQKLKSFLGQNKKIYYVMLYPKVIFSPSNYSNPLKISLVEYFQELSLNIYKKNRYFFSQTDAISDNGLIFPNKNKL